jgi:hypothetical protein
MTQYQYSIWLYVNAIQKEKKGIESQTQKWKTHVGAFLLCTNPYVRS